MFLNKGNFKTNTHQITIYHARGGGMKMYKIKEICHLEKGKQIDTTLLSPANPYKYINGGTKESGLYTTYNKKRETVLISERRSFLQMCYLY